MNRFVVASAGISWLSEIENREAICLLDAQQWARSDQHSPALNSSAAVQAPLQFSSFRIRPSKELHRCVLMESHTRLQTQSKPGRISECSKTQLTRPLHVPGASPETNTSQSEVLLQSTLLGVRAIVAERCKCPPYSILTAADIDSLVSIRPISLDQLSGKMLMRLRIQYLYMHVNVALCTYCRYDWMEQLENLQFWG